MQPWRGAAGDPDLVSHAASAPGDSPARAVVGNLVAVGGPGVPDFDDGAGDEPTRPCPDPDDRLWRHPSESVALSAASTGWRRWRSANVLAGTALILTAAGALAAGWLLTTGWTGRSGVQSESVVSHVRPAATDPGGGAAEVKAGGGGRAAGPAVQVSAGVKAMVARMLPGLVAIDVRSPTGRRSGTGVVFRSGGMVLTTRQLVAGASAIVVSVKGGRRWDATLVGDDRDTGVAVVRVPATIPPVALGPPPTLQVGQLAVGVTVGDHATGSLSISIGVLDAVHQQVHLPSGASVPDALETDAPPADPLGGLLLDERGQVIGLIQATVTHGSRRRCVGVPIDLVSEAADQLATTGRVAHGWLGVMGANLAPSQAQLLDVAGGVVVAVVEPGSPAAVAGLSPGDVIDAVDGSAVRSMAELQRSLWALPAGTSVSLGINRHRAPLEVRARLGARSG